MKQRKILGEDWSLWSVVAIKDDFQRRPTIVDNNNSKIMRTIIYYDKLKSNIKSVKDLWNDIKPIVQKLWSILRHLKYWSTKTMLNFLNQFSC